MKQKKLTSARRPARGTGCSLPDRHTGPHRCDSVGYTPGGCNQSSNSRYRDRRPCPNPACGFVAMRTIYPPGWMNKTEETIELCPPCKYEDSARNHLRVAAHLRAKAAEMRAKRGKKKKAHG